MQFILASTSPRRRELLEMLGVGPLLVRPVWWRKIIPI